MSHDTSKACVMKLDEHAGTINDMFYAEDHKMLMAATNDGMLGVFDLRKGTLYAMSDNFEEDQTAVCLIKDGKKALTAQSDGVINLFSWGDFGDCNDRLVNHPGSIDTMIKFDEDTIITGCEDGLIRAVSILPNRVIAILGDAIDAKDEVFHIQRVTLSHDKRLLASCSLDNIVKIIEVDHLAERPKDGRAFDMEAYEQKLLNNKLGKGDD